MGALIRSGSRQTAVEQQAVVQGRQYLTFMVAGESFGIAISSVKEIIEYRPPTEVPMLPAYLRGIVNLRGRVLPVIDLVARFGRGKVQPARRTCIVILEVQQNDEQHDIGVVVDAVSAVVEIADLDIEPAPSFGANLRADFISGMGKLGEQFVILLDIGKVLSIEELALLGAVSESEAPLSETRSTYPAALQAGEAAASR